MENQSTDPRMGSTKPVGEILEQAFLSTTTTFTTPSEPDILTEEEKAEVKQWAIKRAKDHQIWKMKDRGLPPGQIDQKISEVNWEEVVDVDRAYATANSNKHYQLWEQEQASKRKQEADRVAKDLIEHWTAAAMYSLMKFNSVKLFDKDFIEDDNNKLLIKTLCLFVSNDPRFETDLGYSFKKGLWIRGKAGLGKTHLVKCLYNNGLNSITCKSMIEITDEIKSSGEYELDPFRILYLDDVGTEETPVVYYGTKYNWFKDFIELYYAKNLPFRKLIISTNASFENVDQKYGFRVRSRIKDMFNVVDIYGDDRRGNL